jgi:zinc protease
LVSLVAVVVFACAPVHAATASAEQRFTLDNGLRVILRPTAGAQHTALVVLYDIGERHDPHGRSGMGHLVEHLYVTCAAGVAPARTADAFFARYSGQANAQTGAEYTVLATVFPNDGLQPELADAAARMRELRIEQVDLDRELPRIDIELQNMYRRIPHLAAMNVARQAAVPMQTGARKGGVQEQIADITAEEIRERHRRLYKPRNARLVLVGDFDADQAATAIRQQFGAIESGEPPAPPEAAAVNTLPPLQRVDATDAMILPGNFVSAACIAFAAPQPTDELYAAFLLLEARMQMRTRMSGVPKSGRPSPITFAPLDDPTVLFALREIGPDQSDDQSLDALREQVRQAVALGEADKVHPQIILFGTGAMLAVTEQQDNVVALNPYGTAFMLGRMDQFGITPHQLNAAIKELTREQVERCAVEVFGPNRGAAAVVRAK